MHSLFRRQPLILVVCALVFAISFPATAYAVDGCSAAGFKVADNIIVDNAPFGMAVADFNSDGHLDVVISPNSTVGNLIMLFGRGGNERFDPPVTIPAGGQTVRLTVADFNGDGKPDLAASLDTFSQAKGFSILLNDGTGGFGAPNIVTLPGDPYQAVVGDLNNDGKLDIVTGLYTGTTDGRVAVLLGNGLGGFSLVPTPFFTFSFNSAEVVIGDFNEDGKADLAIPANHDGVDLYLGDGAGNFAAPINISTGVATSSLTSGDFNNDGHLDLFGTNQMLLGTGMANFAPPIVIPLPENSGQGLAGDLNDDGHLDVLMGGLGGLTVFLGNGTGNLTRGDSYSSGVTIFGGSSQFAALGDFNEDGKTDIAAAQRLGVGILDGDGTGAFNDSLVYTVSTTPRYLIAADFNNDGKQDFATIGPGFQGGSPNAKVEVALGDGSGNFTRKSVTTFGGMLLAAIEAADFNGDGKLDLAVTIPSDGLVSILLNDGTGGFLTNGFLAPFVLVSFQPWAIKAGDFNGDNKLDLFVITRGSNSYAVLNGNGSGGFVINSGGPLQGTNSFFDELGIADFNADNKLDVAVIRSGANIVNVLQGNGTGQFFNYATASVPGIPVSLVVNDLNGDGKPDIAVTNHSLFQSYLSVLINDGISGFNAATNYETEAGGIPAIGDFNGDGKPDLVLGSGAIQVGSNVDGIVVFTNNGNGTFSGPIHFSVSPSSEYPAVKDFNGDGKDDVVISQPGGSSISLLLNNFTTAKPCLSVNDVTVTETDAGTVDATFTIKLGVASAQTVRVNYFTPPYSGFQGSSTQGADFERVAGSVTFLPGETEHTVNVPVKGDLIDEPDQSVALVLTTPINALISDGRGLLTIVDNDPGPVISVNDVSVVEGTQTQSSVKFTVSLSLPSEKDVSVKFAFAPGTASANTDYPNFTATVNFAPGVVTGSIIVPLVQDNVFEPDETFFVNLSDATNATIGDGQGQATILNDDPLPSLTVNAGSVAEGSAGTTANLPFQVRLSNPSFQTITVSYSTAEGTATAGGDYTSASGTVSFNPGETVKTINVEVLGDNIDEIHESFSVNLTDPTNATIAGAQASGTILDDDGPTLSINSVSVVEGQSGISNAVFTVTLSAPSVQEILVTYGTSVGTAFPNIDFQSVFQQSLFIPAGATSRTLNIRVFGDFQIEPDEQFFVNLLFASNATIANGKGTGTIVNDDSNGKFQFSSQTYDAGEDFGNAVITVSRVDGATGTVTVDYATSNGTAAAGSDYTATSGTLTFVQGETSKTFSVPILTDNVFEADETVNLTLSNPTGGATLGNPTTSVLSITIPALFILIDESGPLAQQAAALDSVWFMRDPFPVIATIPLYPVADQNTRVIIFVSNLQLAPGDLPSTVKVNLFDSFGQSHDVDAVDMRPLPLGNFMQVTFRLPDNLHAGDCSVTVKAHNQESNTARIRIN